MEKSVLNPEIMEKGFRFTMGFVLPILTVFLKLPMKKKSF